VLTKSECNAIIQRAEEAGFEPALLNTGYGREVYRPEKRNSDRVIIDAKEFAVKLYERLKEVLPETYSWEGSSDRYKVAGLNERMRILRYKPGHSFAAHSDGPYKRPDGSEVSYCTVMIYLNGGLVGGSTLFLSDDSRESTAVVPEAGRVLVFDHPLVHEGEKVMEGIKYAIRTDLMFESARTIKII
jgi:prolyl 4-hydroxylase